MRRAICLIMMVATFFVVGCSHSNSFPYVGQWIAHRPIDPTPSANPEVLNQISMVSLTIENGGTFTLVDAGQPATTGTFEIDGDHAILTATKVMGQAIERQDPQVQARVKPIRLTPQSDGTMRYFDPGGFDQTGLILRKVEATKPK